MKCGHCGKDNDNSEAFCSRCGREISIYSSTWKGDQKTLPWEKPEPVKTPPPVIKKTFSLSYDTKANTFSKNKYKIDDLSKSKRKTARFNSRIGWAFALIFIGGFIGLSLITGPIALYLGYKEHKNDNLLGTIVLVIGALYIVGSVLFFVVFNFIIP